MSSGETGSVHVLVIDDEPVMLESCSRILGRSGFVVDTESDPFTGRDKALTGPYELVLLDVRMPDLDGMEILSALRERRTDLEVIIITGYSTIESAVQATKLGAFDYLPKPFTPDELRKRVTAALEHLGRRRAEAAAARKPTPRMVGESEAMRRVYELIARVAPTDATVLVTGESGTGKELAAQEIHSASLRKDKPLVSLDCSALAPGLLESELFGHVKGSFTGAVATKPGLFEIADHGTLFLDEVSSLSPETQGKLLRVLETGEIKPVGGVDTRRVDIRLVAATNRDLSEMVTEGSFRGDLYYRLNVVPLRLPPLRERPDDIPLLVEHFLARFRGPHSPGVRMAPDTLEALMRHKWPGNVRELKNIVERLVVTATGDTLALSQLPDYIVREMPQSEAQPVPRNNEELKAMKRVLRERLTRELDRAFVLDALRRNTWNVSRAARETGMLRPNFHALMRKYGIRSSDAGE